MNILTQKRCTKCGETKPISDFRERKEKGREGTYHSQCKKCANAWISEYQKAHPDKVREKSLRWRNNHLDKARSAWYEFIASKPAGWDAERKRQAWVDDPQKHREQGRVRCQRRRARLSGNGGTITKQEWSWLKEFYDYTCLCCGKREPEIKLTLDHVLPLTMGGKNVIENAQPLCQSCNSSKHNKYIDYRKERMLL